MTTQLPSSANSNCKTFVASLLVYLMLTTQLAPLALAGNRSARIASPPTSGSEGQKKPTMTGNVFLNAPVPQPAPAPPAFVPTIVATMDDGLPAATAVAPGGTINYTVNIRNNGITSPGDDALSVLFSNMIDAHTTLVAGSSVAAVSDKYNTIGNVQISVPDGATDLLGNDFDPDTGNNTGMTVTAETKSSTQCAGCNNVTINANGSFTYNPAVGFSGTDTFTYTAHSTVGPGTATETVTITVANEIWFINNNAGACPGAPCNGRLSHPFTSLAAFTAANLGGAGQPGDNDWIFVYESGTLYTGPATLRSGQKFIGQDATASLISLTGFPQPSGTDPLPVMNSGNATIVNVTGTNVNGINLNSGNTLRGFTVGSVGTGTKISGTGFGTLLVGNSTSPDVTLSGTGQALSLTTGTLSVAGKFVSVTTTSSAAQGISLAGVADSDGAGPGSFSFGSTTVSGSTTQGILIGTTTADLNLGNTSVTGGTAGISFQNNSAGTRTIGTLNVSGGSTNAFLHGAAGGNVTVTGAATLSSANSAVSVSGPGATNAINFQAATSATSTGAGNTAVTWTGVAGASITFNSLTIQRNNGTALNATGGGTVNVTNNTGLINNTTPAGAAIVANGVALNTNFSAINSTGGTNAVSLTNVSGTSSWNGGSLTGTVAGATFLVSGGTASVTYSGGITQGTNAPMVSIGGGHATGTITFQTGTLSATNGTGLQFDNADGTYNFNGTNTLNGGDAGIDILNGSGGTFSFSSNTGITNPSGTGFVANGSTAGVSYSGNITKTNPSAGLLVDITNESSGTITFQTGTLSSTSNSGTGINLNNADGTVNFNGTTTLNGGDAGIDIITGSAGTFSFASGTSINNPTGIAYREDTSTANVTYAGTISKTNNANNAVDINAKTGGTTAFTGAITASTTTANAIDLTNTGGIVNFTGGLSLTTTSGVGFNATGGGSANVSGASNNVTTAGGTGINWNAVTSSTGVTFNNVTSTTGGAVVIASSGASDFTFNDVTSTTGTAVSLNIVTGDFIFHAINSNGASKGITATSATGTFTVNGTATTDGSGGTVQNSTSRGGEFISSNNITLKNMNFTNNGVGGNNLNCGDALGASTNTSFVTSAACESNVHLQSVTTVVLNNVSANDGDAHGINGVAVNGLTLTNVDAQRNGDLVGEDGVQLVNLSGIVNVTGGTFKDNASRSFEVQNNTGAPTITMSGDFFGNTNFPTAGGTAPSPSNSTAQSTVLLATNGSSGAFITSDVKNCTFDKVFSIAFHVDMSSGTNQQNVTFGGLAAGQKNTITTASQGVTIVGTNSGGLTASVLGNDLNNDETLMDTFSSTNINFRRGGGGATSGNWSVTIDGNNVGLPGNSKSGCEIAGCFGISADDQGSTSGTYTILIQNNDVYQVGGGIQVGSANAGAHTVRATIINNNVQEPDTAPQGGSGQTEGNGILVFSGTSATATTFAKIEDNNVDGGWDDVGNNSNIRLRHAGAAGSQFFLCNFVLPSSSANVVTHLTAENPLSSAPAGFAVASAAIGAGLTVQNGCPLQLAEGGVEAAQPVSVPALAQAQLDHLFTAAIERWTATGLTTKQIAAMRSLKFEIADLPGVYLAEVAGDRIRIDRDAGGYGWFVDATPMDDVEFGDTLSSSRRYTNATSAPAGRMDLLTAIMHEIGHRVGLSDSYSLLTRDDLMYGYLTKGERRLPSIYQALFALPGSNANHGFLLALEASSRDISSDGSAPQSGAMFIARDDESASALRRSAMLSSGYTDIALLRSADNAERLVYKHPVPPGQNNAETKGNTQRVGKVLERNVAPSRRSHHAPMRKAAPSTNTSAPGAAVVVAGETVNANIGTLPAGSSVTITYQVTVNNPPNLTLLNPPRVSNQGMVSGSNFGTVSTDDPTVVGGGDPTVTLIDLFNTTTTLASDVNPSNVGEQVTFTATVSETPTQASADPTGTVDFIDTSNGNAVICDNVTVTGGSAQCQNSALTSGTHNMRADYSGDGNFDPSQSNIVAQVVNACTTNPIVTSTADSGANTLREALANVCTGDTITFDLAGAGPHTITLTTGELAIDTNVTINNNSGESVTVSGNNASRVFNINSGKTASIIGLALSGGAAASGAGILNDGTLTVVNSTLTGNNATADGGGIGSSASATSLTLINTTISGNNANGNGGGVAVLGGTMSSINSTISNNKADNDNNATGTGGGIAGNSTTTLKNTIVAGNLNADGGTGVADDISGTVDAASSFNLIGTGGAGGLTNGVNNNQVGVANAGLGALANNGGLTFTHALLPTSLGS